MRFGAIFWRRISVTRFRKMTCKYQESVSLFSKGCHSFSQEAHNSVLFVFPLSSLCLNMEPVTGSISRLLFEVQDHRELDYSTIC